MSVRLVVLLTGLLFLNITSAQTWHWGKRDLIIQGIHTSPVNSVIDSRGNMLMLSLKLDRQILTKHDPLGTIIWKRELFMPNFHSLTALTLDPYDNIYLAIASVFRIDSDTVNTPPFSIVKLNSSGRYIWSKQLGYSPLVFAPKLIYSGDRLYMNITIPEFQTFTYESVVYNNLGGNTKCSFIGAIDTSGALQWYKRFYSAPQPISCIVRDVTPEISINENRDLLLVGYATDKFFMEGSPIIDYPYNCKHFPYGMVLNGNNGDVKWVKELLLDTLVPKPNLNIMERKFLSAQLSNGYSLVYRYLTQDTAIATSNHRIVDISNKIYLYDNNGNLIRKDSIGRRDTGWYEFFQLLAGEQTRYYTAGIYHGYSPGNIIETSTFEARKWDTAFTTIWKKNTEYSQYFPYFTSRHMSYRNRALTFMLQCGGESHNMNYTYFGADSILPYQENMYARMLDSTSFISGTIYFDFNFNGTRDASEPLAPNVLIGNFAGDTIFASTNNKGYFEFSAIPNYVYTFRPYNLAAAYPNFTIHVPPAYASSVSNYGTYIRNRNFGLRPNATINDGQINITPYTIARPGAHVWYKVKILNNGFTTFSGSYKVTYDTSKLIYQSSENTPASVTPPILNYNLGNITSQSSFITHIEFAVKPTVMIGDTLVMRAELVTTPTDVLLVNNIDSNRTMIRGSFDPNMKEVFPLKDVIYDSVINGKQELDYIVHFQNTGNDTAFAVHIFDTLDTKLDFATFRVIDQSHTVDVIWKNPNTIDFYFPNILLPDSNVNEMRSHGFVRYRIKPKTSVQLNDLVRNNASIYFDYNAPVKTNTVTTNFIMAIVTGIDNNTIDDKNLSVRPNPARGTVYYKVTIGNINEKMSVNLYDISGRLVMSKTQMVSSNNEYSINTERFSAGTYFLEVKGRNNWFVRKVMIN